MEKVRPNSWNSEAAVVDFGSCFPQINWEPLGANDTAYGTAAPHPLYFSPIQLSFMPADVVGPHNLNPINNGLESINLQHVLPRSFISFTTSDKWCWWWEFWLYIFRNFSLSPLFTYSYQVNCGINIKQTTIFHFFMDTECWRALAFETLFY